MSRAHPDPWAAHADALARLAFKALIGHMIRNSDSAATAYAMDKTQRYLSPGGVSSPDESATAAWMEHQTGFSRRRSRSGSGGLKRHAGTQA